MRWVDDRTGLSYYRARYYDPKGSRFVSEDPIGLAGGINFYAYAGNSPVNRTDPLGLLDPKCAECPSGRWTTIEYPTWTLSTFGLPRKQGGLISYTCVDNGVQCIGTYVCRIRGPLLGAGLGLGGGQVTMAPTGSALGGFSSGYTLSILAVSSGVTIGEGGSAQSSVSVAKSIGGGLGLLDCETTILGCVRQ